MTAILLKSQSMVIFIVAFSATVAAGEPLLRGSHAQQPVDKTVREGSSRSSMDAENTSGLNLGGTEVNSTYIEEVFPSSSTSDDAALLSMDVVESESVQAALEANNSDNASLQASSSYGGWSQGGDKVWGHGRGMESINHGNVRYYDSGMRAARARCGGGGCALITNPAGHRTVDTFHIHFVHFQGYGRSLKSKLEGKLCGSPGVWRGGGLPCGGRAAFFHGFPGVFSKAMSAGGMAHASVIAWPASCGGSGTIVELAYGCSIEHQIRGDYNPRFR